MADTTEKSRHNSYLNFDTPPEKSGGYFNPIFNPFQKNMTKSDETITAHAGEGIL